MASAVGGWLEHLEFFPHSGVEVRIGHRRRHEPTGEDLSRPGDDG